MRSPTTTMAREMTEGVTEVIWTGELPDAFYDEFVFRGMLTERPRSRDGAVLPGRPGMRRQGRALDRDPGRRPGSRQPRVPGARPEAAARRRRALTGQARVRPLALLCLIAALLGGGRASAHAQLVAADPAAGAVVAEAPAAVTLTFSEPVRPLAARWFPPGGGPPVEAAPQAEGERARGSGAARASARGRCSSAGAWSRPTATRSAAAMSSRSARRRRPPTRPPPARPRPRRSAAAR